MSGLHDITASERVDNRISLDENRQVISISTPTKKPLPIGSNTDAIPMDHLHTMKSLGKTKMQIGKNKMARNYESLT